MHSVLFEVHWRFSCVCVYNHQINVSVECFLSWRRHQNQIRNNKGHLMLLEMYLQFALTSGPWGMVACESVLEDLYTIVFWGSCTFLTWFCKCYLCHILRQNLIGLYFRLAFSHVWCTLYALCIGYVWYFHFKSVYSLLAVVLSKFVYRISDKELLPFGMQMKSQNCPQGLVLHYKMSLSKISYLTFINRRALANTYKV